MSFIRQIVGAIKSPRASFKSILEKPILSRSAALILIIAVLAALANYNYMGKFPLAIPLQQPERPFAGAIINIEQLRQTLMLISALTGLIGVFLGWLVISALIHAFSKVQGGTGSFRGMLMLAGYSLIPLLIQNLIRLIDSFLITREEISKLALQMFTQPFLNALANATFNYLSIFRLWSMALLAIALSENYKLSTARSASTIIITYIIMIFLSLFLPVGS